MKARVLVVSIILGLLLPVSAWGISMRAKFTTPEASITSLELLEDGVVIGSDLQDSAVAPVCNGDRCFDFAFPFGKRGQTVTYALNACNEIGECALSNSVPFSVPLAPIAPTLVIEVLP